MAPLRIGDNPARWTGNLDKLLAARSGVTPVASHRTLAASAHYWFMKRLREMRGTAARSLEFIAYTASRSGEVRLATWNEIDLDEKIWRLPGSTMSSRHPHRVPLSREVAKPLETLPRLEAVIQQSCCRAGLCGNAFS